MLESLTVGAVKLAVTRVGRGPPLLLLHDGASTAARDFGRLFTPLAERFSVVAPDLRGHGSSERVERLFWPGLTRDVAGVLESMQIAEAHVLGVGDGATLALHLALENPERVKSVVAAGARSFVPDEDVSRLDALRPDNVTAGAPAFAADMARAHGAGWQHLLDRWVTSFRLDRAYLDIRSRVRDLRRPVLVLAGTRDPLTPTAHSEALARDLPDARFVLLDCGRRVQDDPEFPRLVAEFWSGPARAFASPDA